MTKKRKKFKKFKKTVLEKKKILDLPEETKRWISGVIMFLATGLIFLSFFGLAGRAGEIFMKVFTLFIGKSLFLLPLLLVGGALIFFFSDRYSWKKGGARVVGFALFILLLGICGIFGTLNSAQKMGGWLGFLISWPVIEIFGFWASLVIFGGVLIIGAIILFQFFYLAKPPLPVLEKTKIEKKPSLIRKIFGPKFKVKEIPSISTEKPCLKPAFSVKEPEKRSSPLELKTAPIISKTNKIFAYSIPPPDLLEKDRGVPNSGDIRINSAIIKKTLQNFDIPVEMSEVNIGPAVTQYTLKPAEGIKLSKITALSNDLALALAAPSIRIEAPIPGRPLVGIEVPNKTRIMVRLRNLIEHPNFQNSISNLTFVLGRDVAGNPVFADLARMPHLLVAGSTGTGKTICLNSIILSLLYRNGPEILKFILIDPKRVEFPVYNDLPHLLAPVIFDVQKTINALKWLIEEMERRFEVLSRFKTRDIPAYNERALKQGQDPIPYIILIIDELADLMAARGKEMEAGIVRLAQMARAVGIHLIVATQRPSVEVITGLIKANITSRITFQVASQVDSRTVIDMAGAEKLLGAGDMLFISAEIVKPKRIQGVYVSEKEIRKVVNYIKSQPIQKPKTEISEKEELLPKSETKLEYPPLEIGTEKEIPSTPSLKEALEKKDQFEFLTTEEDPLYEQAKRVVIEAGKASASLLQRRLRIGYARAARLIDTLEERGVVGPGEGAKPREVYIKPEEK